MSCWGFTVDGRPGPRLHWSGEYLASLTAFADGPVSDTPEPVTPQPVVTRSDSDRDDVDAMPHG